MLAAAPSLASSESFLGPGLRGAGAGRDCHRRKPKAPSALHLDPLSIKGPKGPEPALGLFKKKPDCPKKPGVPRRHVVNKQPTKQQKFSPNEPGGRANVFFRFTLLLLLRQRYVFVYVTLP